MFVCVCSHVCACVCVGCVCARMCVHVCVLAVCVRACVCVYLPSHLNQGSDHDKTGIVVGVEPVPVGREEKAENHGLERHTLITHPTEYAEEAVHKYVGAFHVLLKHHIHMHTHTCAHRHTCMHTCCYAFSCFFSRTPSLPPSLSLFQTHTGKTYVHRHTRCTHCIAMTTKCNCLFHTGLSKSHLRSHTDVVVFQLSIATLGLLPSYTH